MSSNDDYPKVYSIGSYTDANKRFYIEGEENHVGINVFPDGSYPLYVSEHTNGGSIKTDGSAYIDGNVGIGTEPNDSYALDVYGSAQVSGSLTVDGKITSNSSDFCLWSETRGGSISQGRALVHLNSNDNDNDNDGTQENSYLYLNYNEDFGYGTRIGSDNTHVGIGTLPNTSYTLDVNGEAAISGDLTVGGTLTIGGIVTSNGSDFILWDTDRGGSTYDGRALVHQNSNNSDRTQENSYLYLNYSEDFGYGTRIGGDDAHVGIGTLPNTSYTLDVNGNSLFEDEIQVGTSNTVYTFINDAGYALYNKGFGLRTQSSRLAIYSSGSSGIGFFTDISYDGFGQSIPDGLTYNNRTDKEVMRISESGRLGIGTLNPSTTLDVSGDAAISGDLTVSGKIHVEDEYTVISGGSLYDSVNEEYIDRTPLILHCGRGSGDIQYDQGHGCILKFSHAATIDNVNTEDRCCTIQTVSETTFSKEIGLKFRVCDYDTDSKSVYTLDAMYISPDGSVTFYNGYSNSSDDRLKHNEHTIENSIDTIRKLKPMTYFKTSKLYDASHNFLLDASNNPIDESGNIVNHSIESGFIAQEVKKIPELKHCVVSGDDTSPYSLKYNDIFVHNVAAVQELDETVESLKQENRQLKQTLEAVLHRLDALEDSRHSGGSLAEI
jgi:hypothetical protein